jgi:hypothetical protein
VCLGGGELTAGEINKVRDAWSSAAKRAGINRPEEKALFHGLRRSAARNMEWAGVDKETIKPIGGSKTDAMFARYNILTEEDVKNSVEKARTIMDAKYEEKRGKLGPRLVHGTATGTAQETLPAPASNLRG